MTQRHVAVIDIGKTNVKLALVRVSDLSEVATSPRPNTVLPGPPYPHFDVDGHWAFILDGLARFQGEHGLSAITVTTHGAAAALIGADGALAAPILDYEHRGPEDTAEAYEAIRPPFAETGSPRLAMGLNLGAQLFWQFATDPGLKDRLAQIVTYPQFWAHRLAGIFTTDVTSLGCHTDLWDPYNGRFSSLPEPLGIADKIAPPGKPADVLGPITPEIARRTGLPAQTPVLCGIHDSNASLLAHLSPRQTPLTVVSTGTWVIAMAVGGTPVPLDPARDTLVNVNAYGDPVPSARFMGGREHDIALAGSVSEASEADMLEVLNQGCMLMPALVPETGPFAGAKARWHGGEPAPGTGTRSAAVGFYLALVTTRCLDLIGHTGAVIVEGPFARNSAYLTMLQAASTSPVIPIESSTGTSQGAALLFNVNAVEERRMERFPDATAEINDLCVRYAAAWKARIETH